MGTLSHYFTRDVGEGFYMKQTQGIFFKDFENAYIPEILKELYRDRVYDPFLKGKKDLTIIDAGANIGLFTFYAYDKAKRIYAIEPSAEHFETLVTMCMFNNFQNVVPIQAALANENGEKTFYHSPNTTMYSLKDVVHQQGQEVETVNCVNFPSLFKEHKIDHVDFLKLDIEGSEDEVFGGESFTKVAKKIDTIVGEWHTWSNISQQMLKTTLMDHGFTFDWLNKTEASVFVAKRTK